MELSQKSHSNHTKFVFGEDALTYTVKDKSGSQTFPIGYGSIPTDVGELEERNPMYRNLGYIWAFLGFFE